MKRPMFSICGWCRFAKSRTWFIVKVLRCDVSHTICDSCKAKSVDWNS